MREDRHDGRRLFVSAIARTNVTVVSLVDGEVILLRTCLGCGKRGVCREGPDSDFPRNGRTPSGQVAWRTRCRKCMNKQQTEYRKANAERIRELNRSGRRRRQAAMTAEDRERQRARWREEKRNASPEVKARAAMHKREYKRKRRETDRERVNEEERLYYALRREREGRTLRRRKTVIDNTAPRVEAELFRDWLVAYRDLRGLGIYALAQELGTSERRVRCVLAGEYEKVALHVVDRALLQAKAVVELSGKPIVTLDDLYDEEIFLETTRRKAASHGHR